PPSWRKGSPAQAEARSAKASRPSAPAGAFFGWSMIFCMRAARCLCCNFQEGAPATVSGRRLRSITDRAEAVVKPRLTALRADAAEDRKRIAGHGLPDDLAAGQDLAVKAPRELLGLLPGRRTDDEEAPAPRHGEPPLLEPV